MKRFEELNEREQKSKQQVEIRKIFSKKNILLTIVCIVIAWILACLWTNLYEGYQRRRIEKWQQEVAGNSNNYTISWDWGGDSEGIESSSSIITDSASEESSYKDLEIEFVGAEELVGANSLQIYLKIKNPNKDTLNIRADGVYLNNVCIDDCVYIDSIVGDKETFINFLARYSDISANQVGENISEFSMQYCFRTESDIIREAKDDGFTYMIGDLSVNRGNSAIESETKKTSIQDEVMTDSLNNNQNKAYVSEQDEVDETIKLYENFVKEGPNGVNIKLVKTENLEDKYKFYFLITNTSDKEQQFLIPTDGSYYDGFEVYTSVGEAVPFYKNIPAGNSMATTAYINKKRFSDVGLNGFNKAEILMKIREGTEGEPQKFKFTVDGLNVVVN